jgi:polyhydroxyalkanoate synthesis regulator phasin
MNDWENATMEQKIDELRRDMFAQFQELRAAISRLEKRVNALENRPAVGS